MNKVLFSSLSDNWSTPLDLFYELDQEFNFDLDPCADIYNHKTEKYYTLQDNGLIQDWSNHRVFCNPPYGRNIFEWVKKAYYEGKKDNTLVVLLIPARTDTKYFHNYILHRSEIRFIKNRLSFGDGLGRAPFPSMIVIFRGACM